MAFVDLRDEYPVDNDPSSFRRGRPDFSDPTWGKTRSRKHPPYVFSIRGASALVHKIAYVEMHWWKIANHRDGVIRVRRPLMYAQTMCGMGFRLAGKASRTCYVPNPEALLCGRCHGQLPTLSKRSGIKVNRKEAHVKLGCVVKAY